MIIDQLNIDNQQEPKYKIENLSDLQVIKITVEGQLKRDDRKNIHFQAIGELTNNGYHRLLIDVCKSMLSREYSTGDTIDISNYMRQFEPIRKSRIAFLFITDNFHRSNFVNVAQLAGMNIRAFDNLDKAITWLCADC